MNNIEDSKIFNTLIWSCDTYWLLLVQDPRPGSRVTPSSRSKYQAFRVGTQPLLIIIYDNNENLGLTLDSWPFDVALASRLRPEIYISRQWTPCRVEVSSTSITKYFKVSIMQFTCLALALSTAVLATAQTCGEPFDVPPCAVRTFSLSPQTVTNNPKAPLRRQCNRAWH